MCALVIGHRHKPSNPERHDARADPEFTLNFCISTLLEHLPRREAAWSYQVSFFIFPSAAKLITSRNEV